MLRTDGKFRIDEVTGCWIWLGARRGKGGYGAMKIDGKMKSAHRVSYSERVGPIGKGKLICHKCDNQPCINPEHLFQGTYSDNLRDAIVKKRAVVPNGVRYKMGQNTHNFKHDRNLVVRAGQLLALGKKPKEVEKETGLPNQFIRDMNRKKRKVANWAP